MKLTTVKINGKALKALIDTSSDQTLVQGQFVPSNVICTLETIPICCWHGDRKTDPTADIYIEAVAVLQKSYRGGARWGQYLIRGAN